MTELNIDRFRNLVRVIPVVQVNVPALGGEEKAPSVAEYCVEASIRGLFARVRTEFSLFNPNPRVLEGELAFPLPDEAVICGYAIDIQGTMVEGRVVEKEKARIAFENEVKKGIDPGLVEHVKGNIYRTRIYPIPAEGSRRIRLDYVTPLAVAPGGDAALFLPMPDHKLDKRDVEISVEIPGLEAPVMGGLGDKRFQAAEAVWRVASHETDVKPDDHLLIGLPAVSNKTVCLEKCGDDTFFSASIFVENAADAGSEKPLPRHWRILWDASGSRIGADLSKCIDLFKSLPDDADFDLYIFRNVLDDVIKCRNAQELISELESIKYDGGTCLDALSSAANEEFDGMTLLFSDGLDTFHGKYPTFKSPIFGVVSGVQKDVAVLRRMCGGRLIQLDIAGTDDIIRQLSVASPVIAGVEGKAVSNVQGIGLAAEGWVTVMGRADGSSEDAAILLSDGRKVEIALPHENIKQGNTIASAWAARRVGELSSDAENYREELLSLGRHFGIISPVSSMIVFERLEQWLEYNIEPPESLADIHKEWMKRHKSQSQLEVEEQNAKSRWLNDIRSEWRKRVEWWENPVPKQQFPKSGVFDEEGEASRAAGGGRLDRMGAALGAPVAMARRVFDAASGAISGMMPRSAERSVRRESCDDLDADCICEDRCCCCEAAPESANEAPDGPSFSASVTIKAWDPETPYLIALKDTKNIFKDEKSLYQAYLVQRAKYQSSPAFYLDCAGFFFKENMNPVAIRILSNLSELKLEDTALLRVYAWRLREAGELDESIYILRKIIKLRPDEAVSWRDLAVTLTIRAKKNMSPDDVSEALGCYKKAAFDPWKRSDAKWTSLVALEEFNALAAWAEKQKWPDKSPVIPDLDKEFRKNLDTDMRIVLMWDADNTDIDLHVLEPSGEEIYYGHQRSLTGGLLSFDVTTGYGPEEFLHKSAPKGIYKIMTNYFASHQQRLTGPVTVTVTVFTNWGRDNETSRILSLRLEKAKDKVSVGQIEV